MACCVWCLAVAWPAPVAGAQVSETAVTPDEYAARAVARIALLDLRARVHPTPDDYAVTASVLDAARAIAPSDAELLRARIRAAWAAGDRDALEPLTRELVMLDPRDTVAQLRLASARIGRIQTVEGRLAAYDKLLGRAGASIDASVRSRLALDAALLCRESNNFAGYADRLALALQLDATNKDAASLAWQSFGSQVDSPAERFELLLALLMADPTDPNVHRSISTELVQVGGFAQGKRFHAMARDLFDRADSPVADELMLDSLILDWQLDGPDAVVTRLNTELQMLREQAMMRIQQYQDARMPIDSLPKPEDILLAPRYNQIRLVAALTADDADTISASLNDMQRAFESTVESFQQSVALFTPEEAARNSRDLWLNLTSQLVAISWADAQDASLADWTARAADVFQPTDQPLKVLRAWTEFRLGDPAAALPLFEDLDLASPLNRIGLGLVLEELGRTDEAMEVYRALADDLPLALAGVWARDRYRDVTGIDALATPERTALVRLAAEVPGWVDKMVADPREFMSIAVDLDSPSIGATEQTRMRIRLTNLAPIPLGVGGDRPINSRMMLSPKLQAGLHQEFARASAEVIELDRRLRLLPAESITIEVWPDAGLVGWLAEVSALETVRQRWHVLQGYRLDPMGVPQPGVLCLETQSDRLIRTPLALNNATALELADALDAAGPSQMVGVLAAVRARVLAPAGSAYALTTDEISRLATIAASRYASLRPAARALMLAVLPSRTAAPGMEPFDRAAMQEADPALVPLAMVTRVTESTDPALQAWIDGEDSDLAVFARVLQARLGSPLPTYSRLDATTLGPILPAVEESAAGPGQ